MIEDALLPRAERGAGLIAQRGFMAAGRNGAYGDIETPLRNTCHWLVSFCYAYQITGLPHLRTAAETALRYVIACCDQFSGAPTMRHARGKDLANGVMGPAFVLEALYYARQALCSDEAHQTALKLIRRHSFNQEAHCWNRVSPGGQILSPDLTFNHQLYFAATVGLFARDDASLRADLSRFIAGLAVTFQTRRDGRVVHAIHALVSPMSRLRETIRKVVFGDSDPAREIDYHLYNLYAFSLLRSTGFEFESVVRDRWKQAMRFAEDERVRTLCSRSSWAEGYRSGTETSACDHAFFRKTFFSAHSADIEAAHEQLLYTDGPDGDCLMTSPDPVTQRARHYRYWRLVDPLLIQSSGAGSAHDKQKPKRFLADTQQKVAR